MEMKSYSPSGMISAPRYGSSGTYIVGGVSLLTKPFDWKGGEEPVVPWNPADNEAYSTLVIDRAKAIHGDVARGPASIEFMDRYGLSGTIRRQEDMSMTLKDPAKRLEVINSEMKLIAAKLAKMYADKYAEVRSLGYGEVKTIEITDKYIGGILDEDMDLLKKKYPYSFESEGVIKGLIKESRQLQGISHS